jgi:dihydrofolate reductase
VRIVILAAIADNGVIGQDGDLPWRLKSDMQHFRATTMGRPVIMGRKTFRSIGKPLTGRTNIVVSRDPTFAVPGVLAAPSVTAALAVAHGDALRRGVVDIAVIGGADIYAQTIGMADRLVITRVHMQPVGDAMFSPIDPDIWDEVERRAHPAGPDDQASFTVLVYQRRPVATAGGAGAN